MIKLSKSLAFGLCLFFFGIADRSSAQTIDNQLIEVEKWFKAWEVVSRETYDIQKIKPVEIILFDNVYVYTTSSVTGKDGSVINGPQLMGSKYVWRKKTHNGKLVLPNGKEKKVDLDSFASQMNTTLSEAKVFFHMPLLSYWADKKVDDHGIGLSNLVLCVFLHEFTHTQQISVIKSGSEMVGKYAEKHPNDAISDDLLQDYYEKDTAYTVRFNHEIEMFNKAAQATQEKSRVQLTKEAIDLLEERQKSVLQKDGRDIADVDNFFLTLEGLGQYSAFAWLTNYKEDKISREAAFQAIKTKWWSQEEGFAIIYLLSKFLPSQKWYNYMFNNEIVTSVYLLKNKIKR